MPRLHLLCRTG